MSEKNRLHQIASRRNIIKGAASIAGLGALDALLSSRNPGTSLILPHNAWGAMEKSPEPFVLYVHMSGGWHGWTSGLFQPEKPGVDGFPEGIFEGGKKGGSANPFANRHFQSGPFLFNSYSKVLAPIADNLIIATCNARTVSHDDGMLFQSSGSRVPGNSGTPTWPVGIASVCERYFDDNGLVVTASGSTRTGFTANNARLISSRNHAAFARAHTENPRIQKIPLDVKSKFSSLASMLSQSFNGISPLSAETTESFNRSLTSIDEGLPVDLAADPADRSNPNGAVKNPTLLNLMQTLTFDAMKAALSAAMVEGGEDLGLKGTLAQADGRKGNYVSFLESLQLAGLLAATGQANGLTLSAPDGHDSHGGGACVDDAQSSAILMACLQIFWKWVVAKGLNKRVMVIVSSDFSRSPFNANKADRKIWVNGTETTIQSRGTDHWPVVYTLILSGSLIPGRVGTFLDAGSACGTKGRDGAPAPDIPAYTSTQVVASAFLKAWPELWRGRPVANGWRAIKEVWPDFEESDVLEEMLI